MEEFPSEMKIPNTTKVDVAILGWHMNDHGVSCRDNFNLSYMEGVGRTVGKDVEMMWAGTKMLAPNGQEMAPPACHHWNGWNFWKIVRFHESFILFSVPYAYHFSLKGKLFANGFEEAFKMS